MSCDRISRLPCFLLIEILSYLPTKDSVRTSVLSKRWKSLWCMVPGIDLVLGDDLCCEASDIFVNNFMEFHEQSGTLMEKFKIEFYEECYSNLPQFEDWIDTAVDRGVQHLDVTSTEPYDPIRYMPQNIYRSNKLMSLILVSVVIETPEFVVSLPCLKVMHLEDIWCDDPLIMEKLISGSPVLEDLTLRKLLDYDGYDVLVSLRVRSQTLKRFTFCFADHMNGTDFSVEIDAPGLKYLSFNDEQSDMIVVKNLNSLSKVEIDSKFNVEYGSTLDPEDLRKRDIIHDFLNGVSNVKEMVISKPTLEVLYEYFELGQIPKFENLYLLKAAFSSTMLPLLPIFLESCPNLKYLILDFYVWEEPEQVELSNVPRCFLSSLECVVINKLTLKAETGIKLVNYFLENSALLKKLSVSFIDSLVTNEKLGTYKNRLTSTKLSHKCQLDFGH